MTFAGLSDPQDRANVIGYLNAQSDHPLPLPKAPAEAKPAAGDAAAKPAAEAAGADATKAKDQPVAPGTKPSEPVHAL
jgi:cytochrome c